MPRFCVPQLLSLFPPVNYETLAYTIRHLRLVKVAQPCVHTENGALRSRHATEFWVVARLMPLFTHARASYVAQHAEVNKMRASNLAIVFGPSLLRSEIAEKDPVVALTENSVQCDVVETLITNCTAVFNRADRIRGKDYAELLRTEEDVRPRARSTPPRTRGRAGRGEGGGA